MYWKVEINRAFIENFSRSIEETDSELLNKNEKLYLSENLTRLNSFTYTFFLQLHLHLPGFMLENKGMRAA